MMRNYMVLIEESLDKADSRSREIGKLIASQADAASQNLEQQIKQLEDTTDAQIASAARQLREQYERAVNTMNEMLSMTAGEFTQTAQDMRVTAQQVVRDIDSARNELRQAILDLPDETRSNSEAMRKVVADQIEALNTLADVVRRQSTGLDPGGGDGRAALSAAGRAGKNEGAVSGGSAAMDTGAPAKRRTSAPPGARRREQWPGRLSRAGRFRPFWRPKRPRARAISCRSCAAKSPPPCPARGRKKTDANSVSRETESLVMKLNGSARDLVEAIDGKLPAELERRFDHGEQHVYTHRLYQGRGKKMLELLTDRYQNETAYPRPHRRVRAAVRTPSRHGGRYRPGRAARRRLPRFGERQALPHAGARQRPSQYRAKPAAGAGVIPATFRAQHVCDDVAVCEGRLVLALFPPPGLRFPPALTGVRSMAANDPVASLVDGVVRAAKNHTASADILAFQPHRPRRRRRRRSRGLRRSRARPPAGGKLRLHRQAPAGPAEDQDGQSGGRPCRHQHCRDPQRRHAVSRRTRP